MDNVIWIHSELVGFCLVLQDKDRISGEREEWPQSWVDGSPVSYIVLDVE